MKWAGHVACGRDEKCIQNIDCKTLKGRDHSEELGVDRRIILE
jgi:hypothetical protein